MKTKNIDGLTCFTDELTVSRSPLSDPLDCLVGITHLRWARYEQPGHGRVEIRLGRSEIQG